MAVRLCLDAIFLFSGSEGSCYTSDAGAVRK